MKLEAGLIQTLLRDP